MTSSVPQRGGASPVLASQACPRDRGRWSGQSPTAQQSYDLFLLPAPRQERRPREGEKRGHTPDPAPPPRPTQVSRDPHSSALSTLMAPDRIRSGPRSPGAQQQPPGPPPARARSPDLPLGLERRPAPPRPLGKAPPQTRDRFQMRSPASPPLRHLGCGTQAAPRPAARWQFGPAVLTGSGGLVSSWPLLRRSGPHDPSKADLPHPVSEAHPCSFPEAERKPPVWPLCDQSLYIWTDRY